MCLWMSGRSSLWEDICLSFFSFIISSKGSSQNTSGSAIPLAVNIIHFLFYVSNLTMWSAPKLACSFSFAKSCFIFWAEPSLYIKWLLIKIRV